MMITTASAYYIVTDVQETSSHVFGPRPRVIIIDDHSSFDITAKC